MAVFLGSRAEGWVFMMGCLCVRPARFASGG